MTIESNQDRYYSNTGSSGFIVGGVVGFNLGKDMTEDITNNYTTIISHKTDENGNFIDNNNLTLATKTLTYSNIYDNDENKHSQGSYTVGLNLGAQYNTGGYDKEQTTFATLGNGTIIINGETQNEDSESLVGLNRDVNNSQVITKDETLDEWSIDVNVNLAVIADIIKAGGLGKYMEGQNNELKKNINEVIDTIVKYSDVLFEITDNIIDAFKENGNKKITREDIENIIANNKDKIDEMVIDYINTNETDLTEEQVRQVIIQMLLEQGIMLASNNSLEGLGITKEYLERGGIVALVKAIETAGGTRLDNINLYATDENGNLFKKGVQCTSYCYEIDTKVITNSKGEQETIVVKNALPQDENGKYYVVNDDGSKSYVKTDENGNVVKVLSPAYIATTGKYDTLSLGSIHWAGKKDNLGGGLDNLLADAKTNYPEFYNDYVAITGLNGDGNPITNDNYLTETQLSQLKDLIQKYNTADFKTYETQAAERIYFQEPISKLPTDIQDKINNAPQVIQQILMSTYVQFGTDNKFVNKTINDSFNDMSDQEAILNIIKIKDKDYKNRANLERQVLNLFYQQQK